METNTGDIFENNELTKDGRKRQQDHVYYFQKNREPLLAKIHDLQFSFNQYDIVPIRDYYDLEYKIGHWKMVNPYVDRNNFQKNMAISLYNYLHESTKSLVAKEASLPLIVDYDHLLFYTFFMLKIIKSEIYVIPLILDHHFERYKNPNQERKNLRVNKKEFLQFVEFRAISNLERYGPFNYESQGIEIVKWLREKKKKLRNTPAEQAFKDYTKEENVETTHDVSDIKSILKPITFGHFNGIEKRFTKMKFILMANKDEMNWNNKNGKATLLALILLMNKHKYFLHDILDPAQKYFKKQVRLFFESRYKISLDQHFEKARVEHFDLKKFEKEPPFSKIVPPISFGNI